MPYLMWYSLMFSIHSGPPEDFNFDGYVEIYLTCNKVTDKLYLHMNQLEMDNSTIMFRAVDDNDTPPGEYPIKHIHVGSGLVSFYSKSLTILKAYTVSHGHEHIFCE